MDLEKLRKRLNIFVSEAVSIQLIGVKQALSNIKVKVEARTVSGTGGNGTYNVAADSVTDILTELVHFHACLHHHKASFNGRLSLEQMFFTPMGSLRISDTAASNLIESTVDSEKKDMESLAKDVLKENLFGEHMPIDISRLLDLLEHKYTPALRVAVCNHPGLLKQFEKLTQFGLEYMQLLYLQKTQQGQYAKIVSKMPFCSPDDLDQHWNFKSLDNEYLHDVLLYRMAKTHPKSRKYQAPTPSTNTSKATKSKSSPGAYRLPDMTKVLPRDMVMMDRAMKKNPSIVTKYMHLDLQFHVQTAISNLTMAQLPAVAADDVEDLKVLLALILKDIATYTDGRDEMVREMRNSSQHTPEAFARLAQQQQQQQQLAVAMSALSVFPAQQSVPPAAQSVSAIQLSAPAQSPAQPQAPAQAPEYEEVESIFGYMYPGALCDLHMAMVDEDVVKYLWDVNKYLSAFK